MATYRDSYTGRRGKSFKVDAQGYRIDDSGNRMTFTLDKSHPAVTKFGVTPGSYQERIDPTSNQVYFGGSIGGYVDPNGFLTNDRPAPPTPPPTSTIAPPSAPDSTSTATQTIQTNTMSKPLLSKDVLEAAPKTEPVKLTAPPREALSGEAAPRVSTELTGLLDRSNPYIEQARARSAQQVNSRGLLNTTLGAQAGEEAAIAAALPIAQQDAGHLQEMNLSTHNTDEALRRAYEDQYLQQGLIGYQTDEALRQATGQEILSRGGDTHRAELEGGLISKRADETVRLNEQDQAQRLERMAVEQGYSLAQIDANQRNALEQISANQSNLISELSSRHGYALEDTLLAGSQDIMRQAISEIGAINRTQGLTADQQNLAVQDVQSRADASIEFLRDLYSKSADWDPLFDSVPSYGIEPPPERKKPPPPSADTGAGPEERTGGR